MVTIGMRDYDQQIIINEMSLRGYLHFWHYRKDFDMSLYPERGDAVDHITPETPLVVACHLFGVSPRDKNSWGEGYHYNHLIYERCVEWHIPLLCLGDQPVATSDLKGWY